jgi:peptide deformylase
MSEFEQMANKGLLEILHYPHPILSKAAEPVVEINDEIRELAESMAKTMYFHGGVGLAAPQVGVSKQLIVVDVGDGLRVYVNPKLSEKKGRAYTTEGCLSFPNKTFRIRRFTDVRLQAYDLDGRFVDQRFNNILGVVLQHEIHHLSGLTLFDLLPR